MHNDLSGPFKTLLDAAVKSGRLVSYISGRANDLAELRALLDADHVGLGVSITHKQGADGLWYGLRVNAAPGFSVGVDWEREQKRSSLEDNRPIAARQLGLSEEASAQDVLEAWCLEEAHFKAVNAYGLEPALVDVASSVAWDAEWVLVLSVGRVEAGRTALGA